MRLKIPCIRINTPYGPIEIGGKCTPEFKDKEVMVEPPKPAPILPILLIGSIAVGAALIIARKKK